MICAAWVRGSIPITVRSPSVTGLAQAIIRIVLVLPAPFGPRNPNASAVRTSKSTAFTAVNPPKRFVSRARMDEDLVGWGHGRTF